MSDMGMDQEIMNLFLGARDNNKNVSGLLNNLDSPMLAYLAGVYDPGAGQAGGGQMWSSYAGNPDYPFVQDIMQKIQNGADPFYLNSYIDAQAGKADFGGFQDADMKGLAKALYNEYTGNSSGGGDGSGGGSGSGTWWGKAGLRNPTDIYTTADVPLNKEVLKLASGDKDRYAKLNKERTKADDAVRAAEKKLGPLYNKEFSTPELIAWLRTDPAGRKIAEEKNIDWNQVDETTGQIFRSKEASSKPTYTGWQAWSPWGAVGNLVNQGVTETARVGEIFLRENLMGKKPDYIEEAVGYKAKKNPYDVYAYDQAKLDQAASKNAEDSVLRLDEATRKGVLRAYQESGRTPTRDQLGTMLKFVKNT